jgi:hypothetical protein
LRCAGCPGTGRPAAVNAPAVTRAGSRRPGACLGTNIAPCSTAGTTYCVAVVLPLRILRARVSVPADRPGLLSLWSNASGTPAEVTARAGNGARVLHEVYLHCTDGQDDTVSQRIEGALNAGTGITHSSPHAKASGYTHRRHHPIPCPLSVRKPVPVPPTAHGRRARPARNTACRHPMSLSFPQLRQHLRRYPQRPGDARIRPTHSPRDTADGPCNRSLSREKPVTRSSVTDTDLRKVVAGVGFEPT